MEEKLSKKRKKSERKFEKMMYRYYMYYIDFATEEKSNKKYFDGKMKNPKAMLAKYIIFHLEIFCIVSTIIIITILVTILLKFSKM